MGVLFYDIFKRDDSGTPVWVESVSDLESAKSRIIELSAQIPGQYVVSTQRGRVVSSGTILASPAAKSVPSKAGRPAGDRGCARTESETLW